MEETKTCKNCGQNLPLTEFIKDARLKTGRAGICKPCFNKKVCGVYFPSNDVAKSKRDAYRAKLWTLNLAAKNVKRCSICFGVFLLSNMVRSKNSSDGLTSHCKNCANTLAKQFQNSEKGKRYLAEANKGSYQRIPIQKRRERYERQRAGGRKQVTNKLWWEHNRDKQKINANIQRAKRLKAEGSYSKEEWDAKYEEYSWQCYLCGIHLTKTTVIHEHRTPLSRGGTNYIGNLAPSCRPCNQSKGHKTEKEYREWALPNGNFLRRSVGQDNLLLGRLRLTEKG